MSFYCLFKMCILGYGPFSFQPARGVVGVFGEDTIEC